MRDLLFALMFDIEQKCQLENLYPRLDSNAESLELISDNWVEL